MRLLQFLAFATIVMLSVGATDTRSEEAEGHCAGMFVVLTSADHRTQMFALDVAAHTAKGGKSVAILLCGPAGDLALRESHAAGSTTANMSPNLRLRQLMVDGVTVQVCPHYLSSPKAKRAGLTEGVSEAVMPTVAKRMMAQLRVLSF